MNSGVLLFLSYLISAKSSELGSLSIISRINENSKCSLSNNNFTEAIHLNELCTQPLLTADDYKRKLHYHRYPLLCAEYYLLNSYICNLTTHGSNVKNISVPSDRSGVDDFLDKLRLQYSSINKFCSFTQKQIPNFLSFTNSSLKDIDDYFKQIVGSESTCVGVCKNILDESVSDLCNIIVWSQLKLIDGGLSPQDDKDNVKPVTDETYIEKIPSKHDAHQDLLGIDRELVNTHVFESNSKAPSKEIVHENSLKPSERSNIEFPQNSGKVHPSPGVDQYTEINKKGSETVSPTNILNPDPVQTNHIYAASNETNLSNPPQLVTQYEKKQEFHAPKSNNKNELGVVDADEDEEADDDNDDDDVGHDGQNFHVGNVNGQETSRLDPENAENKKSDSDVQLEDNLMSSMKQAQGPDVMNERPSFQSAFRGVNNEDSHFFTYFVSMGVVCIVMYILFHNKKKILALAVEGRRGRSHGGGRRRPNTAAYSKLDSNLEEAMVSNVSQASVTHVLY